MDIAFGDACGYRRVLFLCKNSFACAGKTLSERADSSPYSGFDFCAIVTDFLQSGGARTETEGMARLLLLFQTVSCLAVAALLVCCPMKEMYREIFEGAMVCLICPTATAAAVITGKLGGSASSLTTYTLLSNLLAAVAVPLVFPWVEPHADITFFAAFLKILSKVFPLLLLPFFIAWFLRVFVKKAHRYLLEFHDAAFYLWAVALAIVSGQTVRSLVNSDAPVFVEVLIALAGLIACCVQFYLGKRIGGHYNDRISGGQALGQKNTVLAIWMSYTYLNPLSSVGPGSYVLWQNIINSYQLWKKRKRES